MAHMPTDWRHCSHCERLFEAAEIGEQVRREMLADYPPEVLEETGRLALWLQELLISYGQDLQIRVVDPQSLEGFALSLRYWIRRYPTFILNGRTVTGWDQAALQRLLTDQTSQGRHSDLALQRWTVFWQKRLDQLRRAWRALAEIFYGMTTFDWARDLRRTRGEVERLFVLVVFGDILGLPILPPYYTLRLLPYVVPVLGHWRRNLLRERDWTDLTEFIEGID